MSVAPGWYKDPAEPTTQRYWDGEGWIGDPLPLTATPPDGPPAVTTPPPPAAETPVAPEPTPMPLLPLPPGSFPTGPVPPTMLPLPPGPHGAPGTPGVPGPPAGYPAPPPGYSAPPPGWPAGYPYPRVLQMPAPRPHGLALATPGARLVARLVDIVAVLLLNAVVNGWFIYQYWVTAKPYSDALLHRMITNSDSELPEFPARASMLELTILLIAIALWFAYEVPATANSGQTLGKWLLGIKVMRLETEERLGFGRAWRRWNPLALPTILWQCCGIGFLLQLADCLFVVIDRQLHQAVHDKSAATVVVHIRHGRQQHAPGPGAPVPPAKEDTHESSNPRRS